MSQLKKVILCLILAAFFIPLEMIAQDEGSFEIARVKYRGGGDWYNDPSSLENLIRFTSTNVPIPIRPEYRDVSVGAAELHNYPFAFLTGHGNITLNNAEIANLRSYLDNGGFLFIDDDYGLDEYIRPVMKDVFPDEEFIELPFNHPIYKQVYTFSNGLPKIHEHDNRSPKGYGIFREGRLVVFYAFESNLGDGWADAEIHNNPPEIREKALQMGTNILVYALTRL